MTMNSIAADVNLLGRFLGVRDVSELTQEALEGRCGFRRAGVMALFGGSIIAGGDVLAEAMRKGVAEKYVIVGGAGHTTETFRRKVHELFPAIETEGLTEAEIFNDYLRRRHGLEADFLETRSTNCGNNITFLLDLCRREGLDTGNVILCQDATMQRRMAACLEKYVPDSTIVNFASYQVEAEDDGEAVSFVNPPAGMWEPKRYISLLSGEIPRLTDDEDGYGPNGAGYIAHVDVPADVRAAFSRLKARFGVRQADERYKSAF